jgi:hypothetical protein
MTEVKLDWQEGPYYPRIDIEREFVRTLRVPVVGRRGLLRRGDVTPVTQTRHLSPVLQHNTRVVRRIEEGAEGKVSLTGSLSKLDIEEYENMTEDLAQAFRGVKRTEQKKLACCPNRRND